MNVSYLHSGTFRVPSTEEEVFSYEHLLEGRDEASLLRSERVVLLHIEAWQQGADRPTPSRYQLSLQHLIVREVLRVRRLFDALLSVSWLTYFDFDTWRSSSFVPAEYRALSGDEYVRTRTRFYALLDGSLALGKVPSDGAPIILRRVARPRAQKPCDVLGRIIAESVGEQVKSDLLVLYETHRKETGLDFGHTSAPFYCQVARIVEEISIKHALSRLSNTYAGVPEGMRAWARIAARVPAERTRTGAGLARLLNVRVPGVCLVTHDALIRFHLFPFVLDRAIKMARGKPPTEVFYAALDKEDGLISCCNANGKRLKHFFEVFELIPKVITKDVAVGTANWLAESHDDGRSSFALAHTGDRYVVVGATALTRGASERLVTLVLGEALIETLPKTIVGENIRVKADVVSLRTFRKKARRLNLQSRGGAGRL